VSTDADVVGAGISVVEVPDVDSGNPRILAGFSLLEPRGHGRVVVLLQVVELLFGWLSRIRHRIVSG